MLYGWRRLPKLSVLLEAEDRVTVFGTEIKEFMEWCKRGDSTLDDIAAHTRDFSREKAYKKAWILVKFVLVYKHGT